MVVWGTNFKSWQDIGQMARVWPMSSLRSEMQADTGLPQAPQCPGRGRRQWEKVRYRGVRDIGKTQRPEISRHG